MSEEGSGRTRQGLRATPPYVPQVIGAVAIGEFELIERFFAQGFPQRDDVVLGVGDDAAAVRVPAGSELIVAADTLVSGVHFPEGLAPEHIGYRALAVNLSDLAAMGAAPAWCTLALTLPGVDELWLENFSRGLRALAVRHQIALIGGDTTRGPLALTVQILGLVPAGAALRRDGARPGDAVFVSGTAGDAAAGLALVRRELTDLHDADERFLRDRFLTPAPRVDLGLALRGIASAAIDVSDGLHADLGKLLRASAVGARLDLERLPLSEALVRSAGPERARELALAGGDDYELCFTVADQHVVAAERAAAATACRIQRIGSIEAQSGLRCFDHGHPTVITATGYDHFARAPRM